METPQLDISEDLAKAKDGLCVLSSLLPEGGSSAGAHRIAEFKYMYFE